MSAQLTCDPIIKITLTDNTVFDEVAPGYVCDGFKLTKGLLKPNKFEFILRKELLTVEPPDITFELRKQLLAAMVEVKVQSRREEWGELLEYEVEDFFYGFIQNIQVFRSNGGAVKFKCTAYSPDAKMKHYPATRTFVDCNLGTILAVVTSFNVIEPMVHFNKEEGEYERNSSDDCLKTEFNFAHDSSNCKDIPYTVQYNESPYNFLKRMARRHAEFMYYENRTFYFGAMKELPELHMVSGIDLEDYTYEMNMNDHTGIVFAKYDTFRGTMRSDGVQKREQNNKTRQLYKSVVDDDEYQNEMAKSAYETSADFFSDRYNTIYEMGAQPLFDINIEKVDESNQNMLWYNYQRQFLDRYVMSDSLICNGKADRLDLKLGSIIVIEDETKTGAEKEEKVIHKPLKVVELTYFWDRKKLNMEVKNKFKAIPQDAKVPPYLERDQDGFLVYGDFDLYPKCGPQYGEVIDNRDPEQLGRVKVALLWQAAFAVTSEYDNWGDFSLLKEEDNRTPWIWMLSPYQGMDHGSLAIPEIGDMVLVGFEHNNAERPYVMGSRYSCYRSMNSEWQQLNGKNNVKGFRSRSGHTVEIIDKDGDLKDGTNFNTGGRIHIYDAKTHAYDIVLDTDKNLIRMESKGNIMLTANNNIVLHAKKDMELTADQNMKINVGNDMTTTVQRKVKTVTKGEEEHHAVGEIWTHSDDLVYLQGANEVYMEAAETNLFYANDTNVGVFAKCSDGNFSTCKSQFQINGSHIVMNTKELEMWLNNEGSKNVKITSNKDVEVSAMNSVKSSSVGQTQITGNPVKIN